MKNYLIPFLLSVSAHAAGFSFAPPGEHAYINIRQGPAGDTTKISLQISQPKEIEITSTKKELKPSTEPGLTVSPP